MISIFAEAVASDYVHEDHNAIRADPEPSTLKSNIFGVRTAGAWFAVDGENHTAAV